MERYSMFMYRKTQHISFPSLIYRFNEILLEFPTSYFVDIDKQILKFIWRGERLRKADTLLKKNNKVRRMMLPNFNTYYKFTIIKTL